MYHKVINGRDIFRDFPDKIVIDGMAIYNPTQEQVDNATEEQINAGGWYIFIPPEPEPFVPQPQSEPDTASIMEAVKTMLSSSVKDLTDEEALAVASLFPTWSSKMGQQVTKGERLWDDGKLWKVLQTHNVQEDWRPKDAVSLFAEVSIEEWPPIPENIPAENPWNTGDKGTWQGQHYICQIDNCVWNPDVLPSAWDPA